ncbi:MAG TPA: aldo/keto reductase [Rhizomicrobium sp.]|nr:aldo/keto reductase [Rhizomicrobium sp.]
MNLSRRHLLATGAATMALPGAALAQTVPAETVPAAGPPILKRRVPQTGTMLPVVGIGTSRVFEWENDPAKLELRKQVVRHLVAGGGSLIDTAAGYGTAEANVGTVAAETNLRPRLFLATKYSSGDTSAQAEAELKQSFQRLRTNYVDLQQAWNVNDPNFSCAQMKEWKAAGRCRHWGITSSFDGAYDALAAVLKRERPEFFQINYSLGDRDAEKVLLPAAQDAGCAVLTNLPFGRNTMFARVKGKPLPDFAKEIDCTSFAQLFLKYNLSHPAVTAVIPGTDLPNYMLDNLNAGRGRMPDAAMRRRIETWFENV